MPETIAITAVEIAHLDLAYAHTRIRRPGRIVELADSLLRCGQIVPIVVVGAEPSGFVLIDGYQRVQAARRAGLDTLVAQVWPQSVCQALCRLLATDGARQFDVFEQAAVLQELKTTHGLSHSRIGAQMGRHPSWVTRRLALVEQLPEPVVEAVRAGRLSSWSASRVIVPLARANQAHAQALVGALARQPLTSRQLEHFWRHYRRANRAARENMAADPILFFKSLAAGQAHDQGQGAPEKRWLHDLGRVGKNLHRLEKTARQVFCLPIATLQQRRVTTALSDVKDSLQRLGRTMGRLCDEKPDGSTSRDRHAQGRSQHPADQSTDENVHKDHPPHSGRPCPGQREAAKSL